MSLELVRESIKINRIIGNQTAQTIVENDIIVPDIKPDIARILLLDGDSYVNGVDVMQGKMLVNGSIRFKILYVSDEPEQQIRSINTSAGFTYSMDIPGAEEGMRGRVKCDIEHMEYELLNERKINVKTILNISGKVTDEVERHVISDISGIDDVQVLRSDLKVNGYLGCSETSTMINEAVEIPPGNPSIREILRNDVRITGKEYRVSGDKIVAKGEVNVSTLYIADDETGSIQHMEHAFPFTSFIDFPEISEEAVYNVEYRLVDAVFEAGENSDGEMRVLKGEATIGILTEGYLSSHVKVVADAYSPRTGLEIEKSPFRMEEFVTENRSQIVLKDIISISGENPDISEVYNVLCKPSLSECKVSEDQISLEGVLSTKTLYLTDNPEQPVYCHEQEFPFRHSVDIRGLKPEMSPDIELDIENCSYNVISAKEVEVRLTVGVTTRVYKESEVYLASEVEERPLDDKRQSTQPSIVIYFAQNGDTLWKIGKRYLTPVDDIIKVNNLSESDVIKPGQQIIIPRRV